ncbi:copper resistance protein [Bacteroidia bacterium]|nr:copper resistance protein [Bacteroidia bacterium]
MKQIFILFLVAVAISGCSNSSKQSAKQLEEIQVIDAAHTSQNSLNYHGMYLGTVPCADCEGIETTIILGDTDYSIKTVYLGKKDKTEHKKTGTYSWDKSGQIITLEGIENAPNKYFVGENYLRQLDINGDKITGPLAEKYILKK